MINHGFNTKYKTLIVSVVSILLVLIVTLTFAYYIGSSSISNTLNITTRIENNNGAFIATGSNIKLNITRDVMSGSVSDEENAAVENNSVLNVEYLSGTNERIICRYDINYEWVSDNNSNPYSITNNEKKEFTYEIYDVSGVPIIPNDEINSEVNFVSSSDRAKHTLKTLYISSASKTEPTYQSYKIDTKFYNFLDDQSSNAGKNWNIKFYVDNIICGIKSEVVYETLSGNNAEVIQGDTDTLNIRINADYNKFTSGSSVYVDDNFVDPSNYTSESGSTIIKFKPEYVENLSVQNHIIKVEFNDGGIGEVTFKVSLPEVEITEPITNETYIGRTINLSATTNSKTQNIEWESDNPNVATVDSNGVVTGIGVGKAKIKAKVGSIESEEVEINVKTDVYDVNITDQNNKGETLGNRKTTCNIFENKTITPKEGGYSGYNSPNSETITCGEENNITLTYNAGTYNINITDTSSNGELGTRTETCVYRESTIVPVGSYIGYSSPTAESITCGVTNTKTYTYTPAEYVITVTDKNTDGETLGTRSIACTYGVSTTVNAGTYTGYASPSNTSTLCGLSNSATNNIEMTYTANTYDVAISDVSSNGSTLGTRTESCTYGKSYTPTVTSYTGHTSPSTSSITCSTTNSKTYTYEASTYNVTINDKKPNGTVLGTRSDTCIYGTSYRATAAANGTYTGYNAPTSIDAITCGTSNTVNITYVARDDMPVTINYNSSTSGVGSIHSVGSDTCTYDAEKTVSPITIDGYTSPSSKTFTCGSTNTVTFSYAPTSYTITYTLNSGTVSTANRSSYTIETNTFTLNNPTRSYYIFDGWTGSNGSTKQTSVSITKGSTGNKSYTANWTANYYNVSYNANNGSGAPSAQNNITWNSNVTIPSTTPTRSNYTFLGWSTSSSATSATYTTGNSYNLSSLTTRGGTVTLYAVWKSSCNTNYTGYVVSSNKNWEGYYKNGKLTKCYFRGCPSGGCTSVSVKTYKIVGTTYSNGKGTLCNGGTTGKSAIYMCTRSASKYYNIRNYCYTGLPSTSVYGGGLSSTYTCP